MSVQEPDEKPLDPAAERIVAKVRWLMMISGATTLIAVAAVLGVIGYRLFNAGGSAPPAAAVLENVALPRGARVIATAATDGRIVVTIEVNGATEIRTFDARTLKPAGQLRLRAEP